MKRFFTRLKALLLIHFSLWFTSLSAQTNITTTIGSYNSSTCAVGDTIVLPVSVNMASGISISAISLTIDFDNTKLLCIPTAPNSGVYATQVHSMVAAVFLSNVTFFPNQNPNPPYSASTRNQFRAAWFNLVPVAFNGIMFNLRFVVLSTGSSTVKWDLATPGNCDYSDERAESINNCEFTDGNITCGSAAIGPCAPLNASITPSGPTSFCQGDSVTLEAYISAGLTYQWRNNGTDIPGATNATYVTSNTGLYSVLITDGSTCSSLLAPVPVTAIFNSINNNDTTICSGSSLKINVSTYYSKSTEFVANQYYDYDDFEGGPGSSDDWSERNGVDPQIVSNTSFKGNNSLYFNNGWGRNFEFQTEIGQPFGGYFTADYPFISMAYKIPPGSFTSMLVHIAGHGWRGIAFTQGEQLGCYGPKVGSWNENDTLVRNNQWHFKTINLHNQLQQSLGTGNYKIESIIFHDACTAIPTQGEMWIDDFMITRLEPITSYSSVSWSNGDTTASITVSPTQTTTYYATFSNGIHSCLDSVTVNVIPNPLNPNLFAVDSLFHCGDSLNLQVGLGFDNYQWSTGDTSSNITVRRSGWYTCRAMLGICEVKDSAYVSLISDKIIYSNTPVCVGTPVTLRMKGNYSSGLRSGMIAHWAFNGEGNSFLGTGFLNDYEQIGYTTDRFGIEGRAASFNGINQYIQTRQPVLSTYGPYTISFWAQTNSGSDMEILGQACSSDCNINGQFYHDLRLQLNAVQCQGMGLSFKNEAHFATAYATTNDGQWHHYTMVLGRNSNYSYSNIEFYRDGLLLPVDCGHNWGGWQYMLPQVPTRIGAPIKGGTVPFVGKLDELLVWNRALNRTEINDVFSQDPVRYLWSTGDTTPIITVVPSQTTTYFVTMTSGGHVCYDSVVVQVVPNTINPNLFAADSLFHCGDSLVLDAGTGYSRYVWSSGDTTQTKLVRSTGWYKVRVFDGVCSVEDSIYVSIIDDNISNTFFSVCKGSEVKLTTKRAFPQSLNNGLVGLWHGNNSTDDAGPNFYNAISNQVTYGTNRFNKPRSAFVFNSFSQLTTQCSISSPSYTIAFWSISDSCSNGFTTIVDLGNKVNGSDAGYIGTGPCNPYCGINQSSRFIYDGMGGCNNILMSQPNSILAGSWVHTAISRDSNGMTNLYLNGTLVDSTNILDYNGYTQIQFGNPGVSHKGKLDEIGLWDRRLTSAEVLELFNSNDSYLYLWSTGDTTSSITVSPTQTTTYYVTISNGIHSCVDSVTVRVTPKVFVPDMAVCQGDTINVPIIASSLDSVAAISLALNYNQQAMTYVGYTRLRPDMVSTTSIGTAPGQVRLGWFGLSPLISTGPDTLVYYRFVVNQPGGFNWNTQVQGDCELADLNLNILDYCFEAGNFDLIDTVNILGSSQGPFEVEVGASIPLSVQSTGATSLQWQRWNPQQGVWTNLQNNADYAGAESGTLTYTCNTYQRPFPLFRLQLSNGCRNWYGPAMQVSLKQRITISVGQLTACQGDTVEVPLTVTGARELGAVSLTLGFNPGAVQFVDWINTAASTQSNIWLSNQVGNEIRLAWFSLISANIPDGNALGTLRIVVTNSTPLTWDLVTPGNCEFGDEDAETIPAQFLSGNLTVNSLPTVNLGISSPFICPNAGSATLSTISDPNYTYAWYFNGQILPNSSDHSITTNLAGTYQVLVTNSSGCMRWSSLQTLGHYPLPNPVITATGSTTTCNQPVSLSVNSTQGGAVEYRWFLNGTLLSTTPSNQWVATVSGSYSVQAIDIGTGCSAWSSAMAVAINPLPNPVITFNGPSTFCLGDSLLLNIPNLSGHLYQWNSGSLPIPGATSASLMVRQGGQYTVQVTNEFACQNLSSPVTITTQNCNALSGVLSYNNTANTVLRNSKVYLALQNGSLVDSSATNNSGQYSIAGYSNNLYQIRATSSINWGGVNATDALGTVRHYTNVVPITGLRLKAADVNGSNSVNNTDALLITRRYSNLLSGFNVGNWASENISIQAAGTPLTQNLKAICYGDINGSYNPSLVRLAPKITVLSSGLVYTEKHVVRWPLYAADNQVLGAVSLAMGIPQGLELVAVQSYMPNGHMEFGQNADELRVGWFSQEGVQTSVGQHLFDLVLRISDEQRSEWTPQEWEMRGLSELADYWATPYEFGRLSMPSISRIRESLVTSKDLLAIPNPSSGDTKLQWTLSAPVEHAYVRVVDALGRVVMEENLGTLEEGSHTLDLPSAGWALGSYGAQLLYTSQDGRSNRLGTILKRIR